MPVIYSNNASTSLSAGINNSTTTIPIASASGFPTIGTDEYFFATIANTANTKLEVVKVTAGTTSLTVTRAQGGTSAQAFDSGDNFQLRVTADTLEAATKTDVNITGGSIAGAAITNDVIDSQHYAAASIDNEHLADNAVGTAEIANDAVTADKLANSINTDIATGVTGNTTANAALPKAGGAMTGAITTNSTFDSRDVATDGTKLDGIEANATADQTAAQIKTHLENGIDSVHYVDGSIDRVHLAADIVDGTKIADDSINSEHIAADSIDAEHYAAGSVDTTALADDSVTTNKINSGAVTTARLAADCVTAAKIGDNVINSEHIAADSIDAEHLAPNSVNEAAYIDGSISREHLSADIIDGTKIANDAINSEHIAADSIDAEHFAVGSVDATAIGNDVINSQHYAADSIDNEHLSESLGDLRKGVTSVGRDTNDYIAIGTAEINFVLDGATDMRLTNAGVLHVENDVVAFSTTISDERLKHDIEPITDALSKVGQLNGVTFTYNKDDKKSAGLIAQDVEKVMPSAVSETELPLQHDDGIAYKTVQYDQTIGLLVEAIKELTAKVEKLEKK